MRSRRHTSRRPRKPLPALLLLVAFGACRPAPPLDADDDGGASNGDAGLVDDGAASAAVDAAPVVLPSRDGPCKPGAARCAGVEFDTCAPAGDGWVRTACFPGTACAEGACRILSTNIILVFDTSGSMGSSVVGQACPSVDPFPSCDPSGGCSRMDVSKVVFSKALAKIDPQRASMALFHFPSRIDRLVATTCEDGYQAGLSALSADPNDQQVSASTSWYWTFLNEVMAVPFPRNQAEVLGAGHAMARWMDGTESIVAGGACSGAPPLGCVSSLACQGGACCGGSCQFLDDPELRATGGTPIGKTLFYVGEYLRHRVVVDGLACSSDASCGTPHHRCLGGHCVDPARHCRETVVVLFTDGGEQNAPNSFFGPLPMAKRLGFGLACGADAECVGGATCQSGRCLPHNPTGFRCVATGEPCQPGAPAGDALFCPDLALGAGCLPDSVGDQTAKASKPANNVLRAPDGRPFAARLVVVDASGDASIIGSFALASAGGGRVLTADTADPDAFLAVLTKVFDLKHTKVCGNVL